MSPEEQINMMLQKEMEIDSKEAKPSESDLEVCSCYFLSLNLLGVTIGISVILTWRRPAIIQGMF